MITIFPNEKEENIFVYYLKKKDFPAAVETVKKTNEKPIVSIFFPDHNFLFFGPFLM